MGYTAQRTGRDRPPFCDWRPTISLDDAIARAAHELRSWGGIAIIGAGASLSAGFPLTAQLQALLWHAVDADEVLRDALAARFARPRSSAKHLIGDDAVLTRAAFEEVARSAAARRAYQHGFARLDAQRVATASPAHDALAELAHRRAIETVVSLNWDTLLETAYRRRYGLALHADGQWLFKPHGDAAQPDAPWTLPFESGLIPDALAQRLQALAAERPRVLLIVGYSESDEEVVAKVIAPLADHWRVVRIGPSATGELSIPGAARSVLPALLRSVAPDPEVPGWDYVTFDHQRNLGDALLGQRLGPANVVSCPRLPEVDTVRQAVAISRRAVIVGDSGSGKSLIAYQTAYDLSQQGWEVLHLVEPNRPADELINAVAHVPHPTVALVDDAQALDRRVLRRLLDYADDRFAVIVVAAEDVALQNGAIRVSHSRAVATIADALRRRRAETLAIVRRLDPTVGEGYLDVALEDRIADAVQNGDSPWQFSFILTGGERRARDTLAALYDSDRADLLLAAIAAGQLVTLDAGASRSWLDAAATTLGRDPAWVERALRVLRNHRAVVGGDTLRCLHLRHAYVVLHHLCRTRSDPAWPELVAMLRAALRHDTPPLRGVAWLLEELCFFDGFGVYGAAFGTVVDDETWTYLATRCWSARTGVERAGAAFTLNALRHWHPDVFQALSAQQGLLGQWLEHSDADAAVGIGRLLNDIGQDARHLTEAICDAADPAHIAAAVAQATWATAAAWGFLLGRLCAASSCAWQRRLAQALDRTALRALAETVTIEDLGRLTELAKGLMGLDHELSIELVEQAVPATAGAINRAPAEAFPRMRDTVWFVLGYAPGFLRQHRRPLPRARRVARRLVHLIDPAVIGAAVSASPRRDWEVFNDLVAFLHEVAPRRAERAIGAVDARALDAAAAALWGPMPRDLVALIEVLGLGPCGEPARSWVRRHAGEFARLDPIVTTVAPEAVAEGLRRGLSLNLGHGWGTAALVVDWRLATLALTKLAEADVELAVQVADHNVPSIASGLSTLQATTCEGLPLFLDRLRDGAPEVLEKVLAAINPVDAERHWAERMRGSAAERRAVAAVLAVTDSPPESLAGVFARLGRKARRSKAAAGK